jgi:hypothetical protein
MFNTLQKGKAKPKSWQRSRVIDRELVKEVGEGIMRNTLQKGKAKPKSWQWSRVIDRELVKEVGEGIMRNTLQKGKAKPKSWQCSRGADGELVKELVKQSCSTLCSKVKLSLRAGSAAGEQIGKWSRRK